MRPAAPGRPAVRLLAAMGTMPSMYLEPIGDPELTCLDVSTPGADSVRAPERQTLSRGGDEHLESA